MRKHAGKKFPRRRSLDRSIVGARPHEVLAPLRDVSESLEYEIPNGIRLSSETYQRLGTSLSILRDLANMPAKRRKENHIAAFLLVQNLISGSIIVRSEASALSQQYGLSSDGQRFLPEVLAYCQQALAIEQGAVVLKRVDVTVVPARKSAAASRTR